MPGRASHSKPCLCRESRAQSSSYGCSEAQFCRLWWRGKPLAGGIQSRPFTSLRIWPLLLVNICSSAEREIELPEKSAFDQVRVGAFLGAYESVGLLPSCRTIHSEHKPMAPRCALLCYRQLVRRKPDFQERLGQRSPGAQASKKATAGALPRQSLCEEPRPNQFLVPCGRLSPSRLACCE
jgi:hypothetical protein